MMGTVAAISAISNLLSIALEAMSAASAASDVLKRAQEEKWPDGDPRWTEAFSVLDGAIAKAQARLT
jgi:hypothetical protein